MLSKLGAICGILGALAASGARADNPNAGTPAGPTGGSNGVCLDSFQIDHTEIPDDSTILFHMKDRKIWENKLSARCVGLKNQGGFAYAVNAQRICSNMQSIRVLRTGSVCLLGQFTPYAPPATSGSSTP